MTPETSGEIIIGDILKIDNDEFLVLQASPSLIAAALEKATRRMRDPGNTIHRAGDVVDHLETEDVIAAVVEWNETSGSVPLDIDVLEESLRNK